MKNYKNPLATHRNFHIPTLSGSSTSGTIGHWLRPKILDTTNSLQRQMAVELYTMYQIWSNHS
jgi:hypothetical protein